MNLRRVGLYYVLIYLIVGGLGFLFFPTGFSHLLLSNAEYEEIPLRFAGMVLLMLGLLIYQIIRQNITSLDKTTIGGRVLVLIIFIWFYWMTHNPFFIVCFCIALVGLVITSLGFLQKT